MRTSVAVRECQDQTADRVRGLPVSARDLHVVPDARSLHRPDRPWPATAGRPLRPFPGMDPAHSHALTRSPFAATITKLSHRPHRLSPPRTHKQSTWWRPLGGRDQSQIGANHPTSTFRPRPQTLHTPIQRVQARPDRQAVPRQRASRRSEPANGQTTLPQFTSIPWVAVPDRAAGPESTDAGLEKPSPSRIQLNSPAQLTRPSKVPAPRRARSTRSAALSSAQLTTSAQLSSSSSSSSSSAAAAARFSVGRVIGLDWTSLRLIQ